MIGSGLEVYPVAGLPQATLDAGARWPSSTRRRRGSTARRRSSSATAPVTSSKRPRTLSAPACRGGQEGYALETWRRRPKPRAERIEAQLKEIPAKPGVYLFRDAKDSVLYVEGVPTVARALVLPRRGRASGSTG